MVTLCQTTFVRMTDGNRRWVVGQDVVLKRFDNLGKVHLIDRHKHYRCQVLDSHVDAPA